MTEEQKPVAAGSVSSGVREGVRLAASNTLCRMRVAIESDIALFDQMYRNLHECWTGTGSSYDEGSASNDFRVWRNEVRERADHSRFLLRESLADCEEAPREDAPSFQDRVQPWLLACFGETIAADREERNHRFLEEALELVQACGCTAGEAHQLVDYVFGRSVGDPSQEVGGVMVTLAALCLANGLDMHKAGETELARVWTKVDTIRSKQAAKPKHSPLPEAPREDAGDVARLRDELSRLHEDARGREFDLTPADGPIAKLALFMHEHGDQVVNALATSPAGTDEGSAS